MITAKRLTSHSNIFLLQDTHGKQS